MKATSRIFANPTIMRKFARRSAGAPDGQATAGKVAGALDAAVAGTSAVLRPVRQAGARAIGINPQLRSPGPIREPENEQVFAQQVAPVAQPSAASSIGQVDVFGTNVPVGSRGTAGTAITDLRQMATNNPEIARALGIRGATAGLL